MAAAVGLGMALRSLAVTVLVAVLASGAVVVGPKRPGADQNSSAGQPFAAGPLIPPRIGIRALFPALPDIDRQYGSQHGLLRDRIPQPRR